MLTPSISLPRRLNIVMDFLRSKQSGIQRDFTGSLAAAPDVFTLDQVGFLLSLVGLLLTRI